jgi:hypothetical protein
LGVEKTDTDASETAQIQIQNIITFLQPLSHRQSPPSAPTGKKDKKMHHHKLKARRVLAWWPRVFPLSHYFWNELVIEATEVNSNRSSPFFHPNAEPEFSIPYTQRVLTWTNFAGGVGVAGCSFREHRPL